MEICFKPSSNENASQRKFTCLYHSNKSQARKVYCKSPQLARKFECVQSQRKSPQVGVEMRRKLKLAFLFELGLIIFFKLDLHVKLLFFDISTLYDLMLVL
jgi:hypothetical protein